MEYLAFILATGGDQHIIIEGPSIWVTVANWLVYGFFAIVAALATVWFKNWLKCRKCGKNK